MTLMIDAVSGNSNESVCAIAEQSASVLTLLVLYCLDATWSRALFKHLSKAHRTCSTNQEAMMIGAALLLFVAALTVALTKKGTDV